ncbi:MAG: hypothetical protein AB4372_38525 [Xenococcus sp. (in: cyanobacteria)]
MGEISRGEDEPLDTSVYALAAANLVGVQRIRWSSEGKKLESQSISSEQVGKAIALLSNHTSIQQRPKSVSASKLFIYRLM